MHGIKVDTFLGRPILAQVAIVVHEIGVNRRLRFGRSKKVGKAEGSEATKANRKAVIGTTNHISNRDLAF